MQTQPTQQELDTLAEIRANLTTYDDDTLTDLIGILTLNGYGAWVSEELADEVLTERRKRNARAKLEADRAAAEQWAEDNAAAMVEDRPDQQLGFGQEYFDSDAQQERDLDGMDYYERMGYYAVDEAPRTAYRAWNGDQPAREYATRQEGELCAGHVQYLAPMSEPAGECVDPRLTVCAFAGIPYKTRKPAAARPTSYRAHVDDQIALADMANKDRQKVQRYARKEGVTIGTAIDALRAKGKIA